MYLLSMLTPQWSRDKKGASSKVAKNFFDKLEMFSKDCQNFMNLSH